MGISQNYEKITLFYCPIDNEMITLYSSMYLVCIGTIHLDVSKFFTIFDPYPPTASSFLLLSVGKFGKFLTPPPPLEHADVLYGWSLIT